MRDTELYQQILGIESPCEGESVQLDIKVGQVDVQLKHRELSGIGDDTLKETMWLWHYSGAYLPDRLKPALDALRSMKLKVARAIKETLRGMWS